MTAGMPTDLQSQMQMASQASACNEWRIILAAVVTHTNEPRREKAPTWDVGGTAIQVGSASDLSPTESSPPPMMQDWEAMQPVGQDP